jgi:hypothetical protein
MNDWRFKLLYDGDCPPCQREAPITIGRIFDRKCDSGAKPPLT